MFEGSRLKIRRANQLIRDLAAVLEAYCKSDFCRIGVDTETEEGVVAIKLERIGDLPGEIPLILGDAIRNLRAALDFLACDIVRSGGKQPTRYTRFPIESTREKLVATLDGGMLKAARPDLMELILDTIRPYKGGDDALYGLHDLDIDEKHRLIVPVLAVASLQQVSVRDFERKLVRIGKLEVDARGEYRLEEGLGKVQFVSYQYASFAALFDKGHAFEGQPIIKVLTGLSKLVADTVARIEQASIEQAPEPSQRDAAS